MSQIIVLPRDAQYLIARPQPTLAKSVIGLGALFSRCSWPAVPGGHKRDISGFLVTPPVPLPRSKTPAEPAGLTVAALPMLPPDPTRRRLRRLHDFEANHRASVPAVYASPATLPSPMQDSLQLADSPLPGGYRTLWVTMKDSRSYPSSSPGRLPEQAGLARGDVLRHRPGRPRRSQTPTQRLLTHRGTLG
jgi:hypothetical protein